MSHFKDFTRARDKDGLISETKLILKNSFGINMTSDAIKRVINSRSDTVRAGMEAGVPRIILPSLGSIVIKKGRKKALEKSGKLENASDIFKYKFQIVSKEEDA